jgi:hypothetical protein
MEKSAAVFLAKVVEVKVMQVTLEVARTWKGVTTKTAVLTTFSGARCGYDFHVGRSYLVYAFRNDKRVLTTNFCTRTMPEASAKADLEALGPGQAPDGK